MKMFVYTFFFIDPLLGEVETGVPLLLSRPDELARGSSQLVLSSL